MMSMRYYSRNCTICAETLLFTPPLQCDMTQLTKNQVEDIATQVSKDLTKESEFNWPDCWKAVNEIKNQLVKQHNVNEDHLEIKQYLLPNEFGHYCLYISSVVTGQSILVDAAFSQFATETGTPFNIGSAEEIDDVAVISPANHYIFSQHESL